MTVAVRSETDALGSIEVESSRYWGAQTQRSLENFSSGGAKFVWPRSVIRALGTVKRVAAEVNAELGELDRDLASSIAAAAGEVERGELDDHFPLVVWQTGSGTQSNMNANEVIANRASEIAGGVVGTKSPVHPNDHVNRGQSSNDVFPTVMHVATVDELHRRLYPVLDHVMATLDSLVDRYGDVVKVGRTHLQDATPVRLGQEIGAWRAQIAAATAHLRSSELLARELAIGGTATGTGLNTNVRFGPGVARALSRDLGVEFRVADDLFSATSAHDAMVQVSAALRTLSGALMKMANDVRWLGSGPRTGIGELQLPENEPGSSIMPGKINPTQAEALVMVAVQVFGNDTAVAFAGTQGNFQLNVQKPVILHNVLESIRLLADAIESFDERCLAGLRPNRRVIQEHLDRDLMLVTALVPHIGYDLASQVAHRAVEDDLDLLAAGLVLGAFTETEFGEWLRPEDMTSPHE